MSTVLELERIRLRAMTAEEKLAVSDALWREAWSIKQASLRAQHPEWTTTQLDGATREAMRGGGN